MPYFSIIYAFEMSLNTYFLGVIDSNRCGMPYPVIKSLQPKVFMHEFTGTQRGYVTSSGTATYIPTMYTHTHAPHTHTHVCTTDIHTCTAFAPYMNAHTYIWIPQNFMQK